MRVAVLGATGLVGRTMLKLLEDCAWVTGAPAALASGRSAGQRLPWRGEDLLTRAVSADSCGGVELALFSAGGGPSREWAPRFVAAGAVVIDNSSAWRQDPQVPLVVPEINGALVDGLRAGIVANPNCSTIQVAQAVAPLERAWGLDEVHVTTFQAVSGAGQKAVAELARQNAGEAPTGGVFPRPIARNDAYAAVHELLVPPAWPPSRENEAKLAAYAREHGERGLQTAITSGQCDRPDGLFYGGRAPAWSNTTLRSILRRHGAHARRIAWIDYHTGLGPCGHGEKIYMGDDEPVAIARTRSFYGADVTSYYDGSSTSAPLSGVCYRAALDECPHAELTAIALEYGTVDLTTVVGALRGDQWLRNHADADAATRAAIKRAVRDAFYVDRADWKAMVWGQARAAIGSAIRGLCP